MAREGELPSDRNPGCLPLARCCFASHDPGRCQSVVEGESAWLQLQDVADPSPQTAARTVAPTRKMSTAHSIIILDDYQHASKAADWSKLSHIPITVKREAIPSDKLVETLKPFSIIHAMRERTKLPRELLEQLPNLKMITTTGMRKRVSISRISALAQVDLAASHSRGIDLKATNELGITVSGTTAQGNSSAGTCEQTWALILALSRRVIPELDALRSGGWQTGIATGLSGKKLGLIGVGRLGKQVAVVGKAFGMEVQGWSPNLTDERAQHAGVKRAESLEELLKTSDVVSIHIIHSEKTEGLLGAKELAMMKPTAFLINTSRGPIIEEKALLAHASKIGGVGLDVFDQEPLPKDHPLRSAPNFVISPHMGKLLVAAETRIELNTLTRVRRRRLLWPLVAADSGEHLGVA